MSVKVLQVITRSELGGSQAVVADLSVGLAKLGAEVMVASGPEGAGSAWDQLPDMIQRTEISTLVREVRPAQDVRAVLELGRLYRSWRPDIVNLHTSKAAAIGRLARGVKRRRIVYTMHGFGQLQIANAKLLRVDRALRSRCGAIVAVSAADQAAMASLGYRTTLIRNGCPDMQPPSPIDARAGMLLERARSFGLPIFLMAAREAPPKRVDLAREVAGRVADRAVILWAGGDRRDGDPPNFVSLGFTNVRPLLTRVDGFMLLSDHEGLPMSLLEAFSAGLPVVTSDIAGCLEALGLHQAGLGDVGIAVQNEPGVVAKAVATLAADDRLRHRMGLAGRRRWQSTFSQAKMADNYAALYRELMA